MTGLPVGWCSAPIAEVCEVVSGGTPKTGVAAYWDGDIPWVTPKDLSLDKSQVVHGGARSITREGLANSAAKLFPAGSVIVSSRAPIGYVAIAGEPMSTNQGCKIAVPSSAIDSHYLYWYLLQAKHDMEARASGTTFKEISGKEFGRTLLRWPALSEQRRIVDILEDHLSRLDAAASGLRLAKRRLRLMAASAISAIGNEAAETAGGVPLGSLAIASGYGTSAKCVTKGAGPAVVRIPNLIEGTIDLSDEKRVQDGSLDVSGLMLDPGDLLFVRTNGSRDLIGRTGVVQEGVRAAFASYLIRYKLDVARLRPQWVHLMMQTPATRRLMESLAASSAGQYNLSLGKLDRVAVPVPTLDEQDRLLARFRSVEECVGRLRGELAGLDARRKGLRQSLLTAAFEGRLTDRVDEAVQRAELVGV